MGDVVGDVVGFVEDAADVVVDVVETVTDPISSVVETVVSPIAEAVSAIPVVGDVVGMAAPFAGILGSVVGGPLGGAIGGAMGNAFDGEGGSFDFLDTAIGVFGGDLPGPLADIAGNLLDGGSLIDNAASVFGGDLGGIAGQLLGGEGGLGDLGGFAQNLLGGEGGLGDLGGLAQNLLGGEGGLGGIVGQVLGGGEMPDLSDIGGLGGLIKTADGVFGGLGLGNLGSAASGIIGDCMPDLSDAGGWLNNLPDSLPGPFGGGSGDGGFELPFGMGSFPSIPDLTGPISEAGGGWLENLQQQAGEIADYIPGGCWGRIEDFDLGSDLPHIPGFPDLGFGTPDSVRIIPDLIDPSSLDPSGLNPSDTGLDDLVFNMTGVNGGGAGDGGARDALQQLAETGNLGEALAALSQDDLTSLVTRLVAPTASPAIDAIVDNAATSGQAIDDLGLPSSMTDGMTQQAADDFGDDLVTAGADAGLGGPDTAGALGDDAMADQGAATSGLADAGQDDFDDGLGLGGLGSDVGGGMAEPEPAMDTFTPEPEPQSDFSQQIAQADAVEDSFDSMFDDLGGQGQG